jgi:hypothetical protein
VHQHSPQINHRISGLLCEADRLALTNYQAAQFTDSFLGSTLGSQRGRSAWNTLRGDNSTAPKEFNATWDPVVFARRVSKVSSLGGINDFSVIVQRYRYELQWLRRQYFYRDPQLSVERITLHFSLSLTDRRVIQSAPPSIYSRDPLGRIDQAKLTARVATDYFHSKDLQTDASVGFHAIGVGVMVDGICQEKGFASPRWWTLSYLGWLPNRDYRAGDGMIPGLGECPQT